MLKYEIPKLTLDFDLETKAILKKTAVTQGLQSGSFE